MSAIKHQAYAAAIGWAAISWAGLAEAGGPPLSEEAARLLEVRFERHALPEDLPAAASCAETVAAILRGDSGPALVVFEACATPAAGEAEGPAPHPATSLLSARFGLRDFVKVHVCRFINDPAVCARLMVPRVYRLILVDTAAWSAERRTAATWAANPRVVVAGPDGTIAREFAGFHEGAEWDLLAAMRDALAPEQVKRLLDAAFDYLMDVAMLVEDRDAAGYRAKVRAIESSLDLRQRTQVAEPPKKTASVER